MATLYSWTSFSSGNGTNPVGDMTLVGSDLWIGLGAGASSNGGALYDINTATSYWSSFYAHTRAIDGISGDLLSYGGALYGVSMGSGAGQVWKWTSASAPPAVLVAFNGNNGFNPNGGLVADASGNLFGTTRGGSGVPYGTVYEISNTGVFTDLVHFASSNGAAPLGKLAMDAAGDLFGTTSAGGANGNGVLFELQAGAYGTVKVLYNFGAGKPAPNLIVDSAGDVFGTSTTGGANGVGAIFEWKAATQSLSVLASADTSTGAAPTGQLLADSLGNLFGTASAGGLNGAGTIWELAQGATSITKLADLSSIGASGAVGGLTVDANGTLWGTTTAGGANGVGVVFDLVNTPFATAVKPITLALDGGATANLTNQAKETLHGTAAAGATIQILDGATLLRTVVADASGKWALTAANSLSLAEGSHSLSAQYAPAAYAVPAATLAAAAATLAVTVDLTAPAKPVLVKGPAALTNNSTASFSLTAEAGAQIHYTLNGGADQLAGVVDQTGHFSGTLRLTEGANAISLYAVDAAGNVGAALGVATVLDDIAPGTPVLNGAGNAQPAVLFTPASFAGKAEAGSTITLTNVAGAVPVALGTATTAADGSWSASFNLLGNYNVVATATDAAGNVSAASSVYLVKAAAAGLAFTDPVGPGVVLPANGSFTIGYTAGNPTSYALTLNEVNLVANKTTLLQAPTRLATGVTSGSITANVTGAGAHQITGLLDDGAGHTTTASQALYVPAITTAAQLTNQASFTLQGVGAAGSTITIMDGGTAVGATTVAAISSWSATVQLSGDGVHNLVAVDSASGNGVTVSASTAPVAITLDTAAPKVTITTAGNASFPITGGIVSGTGEAGGTVVVHENINGWSYNTNYQTTTTVKADGTWSTPVTLNMPWTAPGSAASFTLYATEADAAGNVGSSNAVTMAHAGIAIASGPTLAGSAPITIQGYGTPGGTVAIMEPVPNTGLFASGTTNVRVGTATVNADGSWSASASLSGADGSYAVTAVETTTSGTTLTSAPVTYTLDRTPPAFSLSGGTNFLTNATFTPSFVVEAGATVTISDSLNGVSEGVIASGVGSASGTFLPTLSFSQQGVHHLTATATDAAGNSSRPVPFNVTYDTTPPALTVTQGPPGNLVGGSYYQHSGNYTLTGTGETGAVVGHVRQRGGIIRGV